MWVPVNSKVTAAKGHKWLHWALAPQASPGCPIFVQSFCKFAKISPVFLTKKNRRITGHHCCVSGCVFFNKLSLHVDFFFVSTLPSSQKVLIGKVHMIIHPIGLSNLCGHPIFGGPGTIPGRSPTDRHGLCCPWGNPGGGSFR